VNDLYLYLKKIMLVEEIIAPDPSKMYT